MLSHDRTLWPVLHSMTERARFDDRDFETYAQVNERFAAAAVEEAGGAGVIWLHDYHLMLAPAAIRNSLPEARLAFFLHDRPPPFHPGSRAALYRIGNPSAGIDRFEGALHLTRVPPPNLFRGAEDAQA